MRQAAKPGGPVQGPVQVPVQALVQGLVQARFGARFIPRMGRLTGGTVGAPLDVLAYVEEQGEVTSADLAHAFGWPARFFCLTISNSFAKIAANAATEESSWTA